MNQALKRVLVIEDAPEVRKVIEYALSAGEYELFCLEEGAHAVEKAKAFMPDLIILDILMPGIHGLEVLKQLKAEPATQHIGVFICSGKKYKPDMDAAIQLGAVKYITKPFEIEDFRVKVKTYLTQSAPQPVSVLQSTASMAGEIFVPTINSTQQYFKIWGSRGSVPVAGQKYIRYGGNTPSFELNLGEEVVIIDAGTGIRELGMRLIEQHVRRIHLFIGHTHWDHIQGFPFFNPAYLPEQEIFIYGAAGYGKDLKSAFSGQLASEYFPVQLEDMKATLKFIELESKPVTIGETKIYWEYVHHPGAALGFKINLNGKMIVYMTDNEFLHGYLGAPHLITRENPLLDTYRSLITFISGADLLISEAQYLNEEYLEKIGWGHTSLSNACLLAKLANIKRWIITHHEPMHDDFMLDKKLLLTRTILQTLEHPIEVCQAFDGMMEFV